MRSPRQGVNGISLRIQIRYDLSSMKRIWRQILWFSATMCPLFAGSSSASEETTDQEIRFNRDVRSIFSDKCWSCHGPDASERKADLRLDEREAALAQRENGAAIVPENPSSSLLVKRITSRDPEFVMPPSDHRKKLSAEEKATLVKWIEQGAEWEEHWAWIPPERSTASSIDSLIEDRLGAKGLSLSPPASPRTLIRRLSLDLTGLPPSPAMVEAFASNPTDAAYANLVNRLLASPSFGEHMAVHWLDLVRYGDSNGYHADLEWSVSPYRDYVIDAFNANMPFDQFTREQIAGDLLPDATLSQRVASGYNRLNMKSTEFGIQDEEYLAKYAADRVRTTATTWLGITLGCAECHDHKFDPFTTRDFYGFAAYFSDIKQLGYYPNAQKIGWGERISVPSIESRERMSAVEGELTELRDRLEAPNPGWEVAQRRWEAAQLRERSGLPFLPDARSDAHEWRYTTRSPGEGWHDAGFDDSDWNIGAAGFGSKNVPHSTVRTEWTSERIWLRTTFELRSPPETAFLHVQHDEDAKVFLNNQLVGTFEGYSTDSKDYVVLPLTGTKLAALKTGENTVAVYCEQTSGGQFIDVGLSPVRDSPEEWRGWIELVGKPPGSRTAEEAHRIRTRFFETFPPAARIRNRMAALEEERANLERGAPTMLATVSVEPRTMRVLPRGNWMDKSGAVVTPAIPAVFQSTWGRPDPGHAPRRELAEWLASPDNPLTARVFANRMWKRFFGMGLSRVLDDVGSQGEWPSHSEVLDALAMEFMESGWDIKHLVRLIVSSNTYRQSSQENDLLREQDPQNRLLARQSRFRLEAESIRDLALASSGLLVHRLGGRSAKPYQPAGYWDNLYFPKRTYQHDTGANQYRRGVYTHWQRQFLHPALLAFDAPSREECTASRPRSNTPLAALVMLNDPSMVEAARVLAESSLDAAEGTHQRFDWMAMRVLSRTLIFREKAALQELLADQLTAYKADTADAEKLIGVGLRPVRSDLDPAELAAWTNVARAILNLHETITRY